jgi:hypothetical protein
MKQKIDILITKNHSQTLMDVVIFNPTRRNMVQCASSTTTHATTITTQETT